MFTTRANAFLRICHAWRFPGSFLLSKEDRHELVHSGIGEKQIRRIGQQ